MDDPETDAGFRERVLALVAQIPEGRVMSYGQIAALSGQPRAARIVGGIAHYGPTDLPWHRVVNKQGGLAVGYYGGVEGQRQMLEAEGVVVSEDFKVDIARLSWSPDAPDQLTIGEL
jgi:methylated-DNA-protein-cysteine methyltransferase-like protein